MNTAPPRAHLPALLGWIVVTFLFAALGGMGSASAPSFYAELARPDWAPPASLFGPVWSVLYLLMAVAAWRATAGAVSLSSPPTVLYLVQLVLNSLWSWLFFHWREGALAFACIVVLWLLIVGCCVLFARRSRLATILLLPYLAWVSFASVLCYSIWQLNPSLLA